MRILVLQLKRIGDAILTAPALAMLGAALPDAHVELVLHGPSGGLARAMPGVAAVHVWQPWRPNLRLLAQVASKPWDVVLDFTGTDRSVFLSTLSRARTRVFYERHMESAGWRNRVADMLVEASVKDLSTVEFHVALVARFLEMSGLGHGLPIPVPPCLRLPEDCHVAGLPSRYAVLHPGTARDEKYWQPEKWLGIARYVRDQYQLPLVLTGSSDERETEHLAALRAAKEIAWIDLAGQLGLLESAAVIGRATLVLTVDSAAMHLAGQFGRPQVALFGPTNPYHWAPRHANARVLLGGVGCVDPEACRPPAAHLGTMEAIDEASVRQAIASLSACFGDPAK